MSDVVQEPIEDGGGPREYVFKKGTRRLWDKCEAILRLSAG